MGGRDSSTDHCVSRAQLGPKATGKELSPDVPNRPSWLLSCLEDAVWKPHRTPPWKDSISLMSIGSETYLGFSSNEIIKMCRRQTTTGNYLDSLCDGQEREGSTRHLHVSFLSWEQSPGLARGLGPTRAGLRAVPSASGPMMGTVLLSLSPPSIFLLGDQRVCRRSRSPHGVGGRQQLSGE